MKYFITALMFLSMAHANTEGECRKIFKSSKAYIENGNSTINSLNTLYNKQEDFIISKDKESVSQITQEIQKKLTQAKVHFQKAAPLSMKAISRCSGRSNKAKDLLTRAKSGIQEINFKLKINNKILADL